jgi:hypothetical protein
MLKLSFGLDFADLHQRDGLARLDEQFLHFIAASDPALRDALLAARAAPEALAPDHLRRREGFALTDPAPTSRARWTRPTTASGATTRARTPAPRACARRQARIPPARPSSANRRSA